MNSKIIFMVISSFCLLPSRGYKILLLPAGLETHQILFSRVGEELVKHGHNVTFLIGDKKTLIPDVKVNFPHMIDGSVLYFDNSNSETFSAQLNSFWRQFQESGVKIRKFRMDNISFIDTPDAQSLLVKCAFSSSMLERWELTKIGKTLIICCINTDFTYLRIKMTSMH